MKTAWIIAAVLLLLPVISFAGIDLVVVDKSARKMYLFDDGKIVKRYKVALGSKPRGHKRRDGDGRTPEGRYVLGAKNLDSDFYLSMHISYPNQRDRDKAKSRGVDPGRDIMVHGQRNYWGWMSYLTQKMDWTNGCIALKNSDMEEFIELVKVGTEIEIRW